MSSVLDYMQLCRLCLVKDKVNVPIFGESSDVGQIFFKITACLPIKVSQNDNLPKKICDTCLYKVDLLYQFWNTTVNAEKQLLQWLGEIGVEVNLKKSEQSSANHTNQHSIQDEPLVLKEERNEADAPSADAVQQPFTSSKPVAFKSYDQLTETNIKAADIREDAVEETSLSSSTNVQLKPEVSEKRLRSRTAAIKKEEIHIKTTSTNNNSSADEPMDEDSSEKLISQEESDSSMDAGERIAKEEAESEEEYEDTAESLEPTAFVGVPSDSACDTDQPGPSGLNKPVTSTDTGDMDFEDQNLNIKSPIDMEPIITLVELPATDWNMGRTLRKSPRHSESIVIKEEVISDEEEMLIEEEMNRARRRSTRRKDIDEDYSPKKKETSKNKKSNGYKNPFVYNKVKINPKKIKDNKNQKLKSKWTCLICGENQKGKKELIDHYAEHKDNKIKTEPSEFSNSVFQCDICLKDFTSEKRYEKHLETHNDSRFNCEFCEKTFKRPYDMAIHMRFHSTDDKLKCYVCDYTTQYNSALKTHIKRHESEYKYKCELCGKGFFCVTWYEEHKNFHTGDKPFSCDICGKQFAYTRYMMAHKRSMHPESFTDVPIVNECQFCQKRFAHKKSLLLHVRSHTGENTVLCDICGKRLSSNDHLKLHRRIHTGYKPYACSVCTKSFSKKCNLTLHERVHSGEKPYVCDVCGKCFSQRSTLVIHTRYHTGQRPYVCHLCNKGFVAKGVLGIHLKSCNRHNIMGHYLETLK